MLKKVKSSFLTSIYYDEKLKLLEVKIGKKTYMHSEVPEEVYKELMNADSKGTYYNKNIRGKYKSF